MFSIQIVHTRELLINLQNRRSFPRISLGRSDAGGECKGRVASAEKRNRIKKSLHYLSCTSSLNFHDAQITQLITLNYPVGLRCGRRGRSYSIVTLTHSTGQYYGFAFIGGTSHKNHVSQPVCKCRVLISTTMECKYASSK